MYFVDSDHEKNFTKLISHVERRWNKEYTSCLYVLAADEELRRKAARYIKQDGIDWEAIWEQDWSSGYRLLLQLAESLFKSSGSIELAYGLGIWGEELFLVAMQAIYIRRQGIRD